MLDPLALIRGIVGLLLIVIPAVSLSGAYIAYTPVKWILIKCLVLPLFFVLLATVRGIRAKDPLVLLVLLFIGSLLASSMVAPAFIASVFGSVEREEGVLSLVCLPLLLLAVRIAFVTAKQREALLWCVALGSIAVCSVAMVQKWNVVAAVPFVDTGVRVIGTLGNPLYLASYLVVVAPVTLYLLVQSLKGKRWWVCGVLGVLLAGQLLSLHAAGARSAQGALAVGLLFGVVAVCLKKQAGHFRRQAITVGFVIMFIGLIGILAVTVFSDKADRVIRDNSMQARIQFWCAGWDLFLGKAPVSLPGYEGSGVGISTQLLGWGPDSIRRISSPFLPPEAGLLDAGNRTLDRMHNQSIDILLTQGVFGLLIFHGILCVAGWYGIHKQDALWTGMVVTLLIGHYLEQQMLFVTPTVGLVFWAILGLNRRCDVSVIPRPNGLWITVTYIALISLTVMAHLPRLQAGMLAGDGRKAMLDGLHAEAADAYRASMFRVPESRSYHKEWILASSEMAVRKSAVTDRLDALKELDRVALHGDKYEWYDPDYFVNRARIKAMIGMLESEPQRKTQWFKRARTSYQTAANYSPYSSHTYKEWALAELQFQIPGGFDQVIDTLKSMESESRHGFWLSAMISEMYLLRYEHGKPGPGKSRAPFMAREWIDKARSVIPENRPMLRVQATLISARVAAALNDYPRALSLAREVACTQVTRDRAGYVYELMAGWHAKLGNEEDARSSARQALKVSPVLDKAAVRERLAPFL